MSNKTKFIIGVLFLIQICILIWAKYDVLQNRTPFEKKMDFYLAHKDSVTYINLRNLKIKELPKSITKLTKIQYVDLSFNEFTEIPNILYQLPNLKTINLSHNNLVYIRLNKNTSFNHLNFSHNTISHVQGISYLKKLNYLNLNQNNLIYFPYFNSTQKMDTILLANNLISGEIDVKSGLIQSIGHLDLSNNRFENFEEILKIASSCQSLNISDNFWASQTDYNYTVPKKLFSYSIKDLDISNCILYNLPILTESHIKKLNISSNYLKIDNLDAFTQLEQLNLNKLTLKNLSYTNPNLKELMLKGITIEGKLNLELPNLERLIISNKGNILENLPELNNLKELELVIEKMEDIDYDKLKQQYPNARIYYLLNEIN